MFDANKATARYTQNLDPAAIKVTLVNQKPDMVASYAAKTSTRCNVEAMVQAALAALPSATKWVVGIYLSFGLRIQRLKDSFPGGHVLANETAAEVAKYTAMGLDSATLNTIVLSLLGIHP